MANEPLPIRTLLQRVAIATLAAVLDLGPAPNAPRRALQLEEAPTAAVPVAKTRSSRTPKLATNGNIRKVEGRQDDLSH